MSLDPGTTLGHYEIIAALGAGGMGEVYRAKDTKLGREVAIKLLLEEVSADPERLARFEREARVLASLNHNNIATLHGFEKQGATSFLVMELVEGETLADRISRGPIPLVETISIFLQIAEGLEEAHHKGVVHRDLKPANIKLSGHASAGPSSQAAAAGGSDPSGVKILDFGLATASSSPSAERQTQVSESPTLTLGATQRGIILGTAAYMAPEQARGLPVNNRADIWAFGVCLYEALTGISPFSSTTVTDTLSRVLRDTANPDALPPLPPALSRLLERCLEKDLRRRLSSISEARFELAELLTDSDAGTLSVGSNAAFLDAPTRRLSINLPREAPLQLSEIGPGMTPDRHHYGLTLSADGTWLVYVGCRGDTTNLYRRRLDSLEVQPIEGTEHAWQPFFSPDGETLAFFDLFGMELKTISIHGGTCIGLCHVEQSWGGCWSDDGYIYFTAYVPHGLNRVSEHGGEPERVEIRNLKPWAFVGRPDLLPGGTRLLLNVKRDLSCLDLETRELELLLPQVQQARYVPSGHIVFAQQGRLMVAPFDTRSCTLRLPGVPLNEPGLGVSGRESIEWGFSPQGLLAYPPVTLSSTGSRTLCWVDRKGNREDLPFIPPGPWDWARLSPNGQKSALGTLSANGYYDVWVHDLERGGSTRITFDPATNALPIWTPDGSRLVFSSRRETGCQNIFWKAADGSGESERLTRGEYSQMPFSWSPDGKILIYGERGHPRTRFSLWKLDLEHGEPEPLIQSRFDERVCSLSPDGRWLAYVSSESGQLEVYVRSFPAMDQKWQISTDGGQFAAWSPRGDELFYLNGGEMMSVPVETDPSFRVAQPVLLFEGRYGSFWPTFDVSPTGEKFFMIQLPATENQVDEIVVVENWFEELKRLAPTD